MGLFGVTWPHRRLTPSTSRIGMTAATQCFVLATTPHAQAFINDDCVHTGYSPNGGSNGGGTRFRLACS